MRCWHRFAVDVLSYDESATLPPSCADDVVKYLQAFSNAGTASNYMAASRWSCKAFELEYLRVESDSQRPAEKRCSDSACRADYHPSCVWRKTIFKLMKLSADMKDSE